MIRVLLALSMLLVVPATAQSVAVQPTADGFAIDIDAMEAAIATRAPLAIRLPGASDLVVRPTQLERRGTGRFSFAGPLDGGGDALVTVEGEFVVARLSTPDGVVMIEPDAAGVHRLRGVGASPEGETDAPVPPPGSDEAPRGGGDALWPDVVEIALFYTEPVRAELGAGLAAFLQATLDTFNLSLRQSAVPVRVRYAYTGLVAYQEGGDFYTDFYAFAGTNTGTGSALHAQAAAIRDATTADLAALITTNAPQYCGVAYLMSAIRVEFAPSAYGVTKRSCAVGNLTFPHESGHNLGLRHDPYVDTNPTPFPYSHGFVNDDSLDVTTGRRGFRTIMAYNNRCADRGGTCPKIPFYSRPDTLYQGQVLGDATLSDNARTLRASMPVAAQFRTPALLGALALAPATAPTWTRPVCTDPSDVATCGVSAGPAEAYALRAFSVAPSGRYTARRTDATGGALFLYAGGFDPASPLDGLVAAADESADAPDARRLLLERALSADSTYTLVVSAPTGTAAGVVDLFGPTGGVLLMPVSTRGESPRVASLTLVGPHPFTDATAVQVVLAESGTVRATLVDALGREVAVVGETASAAGVPLRLAVEGAGLAPGVYVLRVASGRTVSTLRLVRMR